MTALEKKLGVGKPSRLLGSHPALPFVKGDRVRRVGKARIATVSYVTAPTDSSPDGGFVVDWNDGQGGDPYRGREAADFEAVT